MSGKVSVDSGSLRYAQTILAGSHVLTADEPSDLGGNDAGPNPYDLLLAALGACTSMTVRMYAEREKWPLQKVHVRLSHSKIHAKDCAECESESGLADQIEMEIFLFGNLSEDQRLKLLEIASKCPVHRTLTSHIQIRSRLNARTEDSGSMSV